jgi:aconitate hydratase
LSFGLADKIIDGRLHVDQGSVAGCAGGTYENICAVADILGESGTGSGAFWLSAYPASQPINLRLADTGVAGKLLRSGVTLHPAFCGPCFGAGDTPANGALSIRHATRNFPHREGSKPSNGQVASVALMDARSIAATALNKGRLTAATEVEYRPSAPDYVFDDHPYRARVYRGYGKADPNEALRFGPYIADWPAMPALPENLLLVFAAVIRDPVTTTDEIIPSGETSSFRSNPIKFAEFTFSRKVPGYVERAKRIRSLEDERSKSCRREALDGESRGRLDAIFRTIEQAGGNAESTGIGSAVFALKPGDGSAREQAASCQKVLGAWANVAIEYATKRYRSNLVNWGILPFIVDPESAHLFREEQALYVPNIRSSLMNGAAEISAFLVLESGIRPLTLRLPGMSEEERKVLLSGCLMNFYRDGV